MTRRIWKYPPTFGVDKLSLEDPIANHISSAYFISDVHLTTLEDERGKALLSFLESLKDFQSTLVFLGDLFDLWLGSFPYFINKYQFLIDQFRKLKNSGVEIYYFQGNHDLYLEKFWQEEMGFKVFRDFQVLQIGPFKVRVEHGDLIDPDDHGYHLLRSFLHSKLIEKIILNLPEKIVRKLGESASQTSRKYTTQTKKISTERALEKIHAYAMKKNQEEKFDFIITGHIHVEDEYVFFNEGEKVLSINLGSWLNHPKIYYLNDQGGSWITLSSTL